MSRLSNSIVRDAHAYTRSRTPWVLESDRQAQGETAGSQKFGWRLFHYLSGGGLRAFGRTVEQEEADAKRTRFLIRAAVARLARLWYWI